MDSATLRRMAVLRAFPPARPLAQAIETAGFVQADPIRAPARAQDLILRHRVTGYRAGDLERRYPKLAIEEAYFYAYGFMPIEAKPAQRAAPAPSESRGQSPPMAARGTTPPPAR